MEHYSNTELTLTGMILEVLYYVFVVAFAEEGAPLLPSHHSTAVTIILCKFKYMELLSSYINNFIPSH